MPYGRDLTELTRPLQSTARADIVRELCDLIKCHGSEDFARLPPIGRGIVALGELQTSVASEGFEHYLYYSGERWRDARHFLGKLEASLHLNLLEGLLAHFPSGKLPENINDRSDALDALERDSAFNEQARVCEREWNNSQEDLNRLVLHYLRVHQNEIEELLKARDSQEPDDVDRLNDEALMDLLKTRHGVYGLEHELLKPSRMPMLVRVARELEDPVAERALDILYAQIGSLAADLLSGKVTARVPLVDEAIASASASGSAKVMKWAADAIAQLHRPDPGTASNWMGRLLPR